MRLMLWSLTTPSLHRGDHQARICTLPWVACLPCGVKLAGSHLCPKDCTYSIFHLHYVFPANRQQHLGGSAVSLLPTGPGPSCGHQRPGEERGCWASRITLQGAHRLFRDYMKTSSSFCSAFIIVKARITPLKLILKWEEFSYFWGIGPLH